MEVLIPQSAVQASMITTGIVYLVVNTAGELTGLFLTKTALGAGLLASVGVTFVAGAPAGAVVSELVKTVAEGTFVPAVKTSSRMSALGIALSAGAIAGCVVTLAVHGGHFVVQTYRKFHPVVPTPIDYDLFYEEEDYSIVHLYSVYGNPPGDEAGQKN